MVEDDGAISFLLRFLLERHGWQVSVAEDLVAKPFDALQLAARLEKLVPG